MIRLPVALRPWAPSLTLFPPELALPLGHLAARLALAIGPLRASATEGHDDPDGIDGLSRRGIPERLLASEWLLADEVPDEFLRRAASGELAYHRLAFRAPAGSRRSIALLDGGPAQLGGPRIVQLAALIVLAARAEVAGVDFAWGALQDPHRQLVVGLTTASLIRLLTARCGTEVTSDDVESWYAQLEIDRAAPNPAATRGCELWLVGAPHLNALPSPGLAVSHATVEDVLDPALRQVAVSVRRPAAPPARVLLDLPDGPSCVRLLRDPFRVTMPAPTTVGRRIDPASPVLLTSDGGRVVARLLGEGIVAMAIPNSPRDSTPRPVVIEPPLGWHIVAVGGLRRFLHLIEQERGDPTHLRYRVVAKKGRDVIEPFTISATRGLAPPVFAPERGLRPLFPIDQHSALLLDEEGAMHQIALGPGQRAAQHGTALLWQHVLAISEGGDYPFVVSKHEGEATGTRVIASYLQPRQVSRYLLPPNAAVQQAFAASRGRAYATCSGGVWRVYPPSGEGVVVDVPAGARPFGVVVTTAKPQLLAIPGDRAGILVLGETARRLSVGGNVVRAVAGSGSALVAALTDEGSVVVCSLWDDALLVRLSGGEVLR